jgi:hypothetical protein
MWEAYAEYSDGARVRKLFPSTSNNYYEECEEQYNLECWLLEKHDDCTFLSVNWISEDVADLIEEEE